MLVTKFVTLHFITDLPKRIMFPALKYFSEKKQKFPEKTENILVAEIAAFL